MRTVSRLVQNLGSDAHTANAIIAATPVRRNQGYARRMLNETINTTGAVTSPGGKPQNMTDPQWKVALKEVTESSKRAETYDDRSLNPKYQILTFPEPRRPFHSTKATPPFAHRVI